MVLARIPLTLSLSISLSLAIRLYLPLLSVGWRLHPGFIKRSWIWLLVGRPKLAYPCEDINRRTSLLLQQYPQCLVRLIWRVLEIGSRWLNSCCYVGCCFQDLFNVAHSTLVEQPSGFFSLCLVSVYVVHPYSKIDTTATRKNFKANCLKVTIFKWVRAHLFVHS